MPVVVGAGILGVAALGGAAFLVVGDGSASPDDVLDDAQSAVVDASSFRFELDGTLEAEFGVADTRGKGAWTDDRSEATITEARGVTESVYDGAISYERTAAYAGRVAGKKWAAWEDEPLSEEEMLELVSVGSARLSDAPDGAVDAAAVTLAQALFLGGGDVLPAVPPGGDVFSGVIGNPSGFLAAIQGMSDPEQDDDTLEATFVAPDDVVEAFGHPIPDGRVRLTLGHDDLPTTLRFDADQGDGAAELTVTFSDWNDGDIDIDIPADSDLDPTPWIDEEGLRAVEGVDLVWPTAPPEGWELTTWSPEEVAQEFPDETCEAIELDWDEPLPADRSPADGDAGYLYLVLRSAECAEAAGGEPFEPAGPGGFPVRQNDYDLPEVRVGDTAVEYDSSLSDEQLDAVLATLAPVEVDTLISAATELPES